MSAALCEVEANGVRFTTLEEGAGPLILLVHGFPDTAHSWDRVLPQLAAAGLRAVAPFTRGYAPTAIPADGRYDTDTLGRDLLALIDALGGRPAVVVGHDWGASAAYAAAALGPERIRLLVTLAIPHPRFVRVTPGLVWHLRHFFSLSRRGAPERVRRDDFALLDTLVRRWSPTWEVPPGELDAVKAAFREPGSLDAALGYYRALGVRLAPSLALPISVPTVAFAGQDDPFPVSGFARAGRSFTGSYEVVAMPGGHFMHREHPERFITELLAALRRHRIVGA